jgi:hypothetical protein
MRTISHAIPGLSVVFLTLTLALTAQAQQLPSDLVPIAVADTPYFSPNYYSLQKLSSWPPLPFIWLSTSNVQLYASPSLGTNAIFVNDLDTDYVQLATEALALRLARRAANDVPPVPGGDDGGSGGDSGGGWNGEPRIYGPNDFVLEPISVASNVFNVILHGTTNGSTYLITSTESLNPQTNRVWLVEGSLQGGTNNATPFALGVATRTNNLFIRAQACDECATTALPLWWQLAYFGITAVDPNADFDGDGVTNLVDYLNGTDPNKISFSLSVTNQYVTTTAVPVQLNIAGGIPSFIAVLINDTNASWQPFTTSSLSVPTPADGTYVITVGLCGMATNATQTWHSVTVVRDSTPLTLALTNLAARSGSRPFIDPAGYASRALKAITWTVVDANGATNTSHGSVVAQGWNLLDQYHTTNWFQCLDLALALGTNWISIQATDWAGTVAVTNFSYVFDTNGDTTAPALSLLWPQDGTQVSGDNLTVQAWTDDDTASVALQYTDSGGTAQTVNGRVQRGGNVWVQNVPLTAGTNSFTLTATDAAGNVSTTNFSVIQSSLAFTVYPLSQDQLKYGYATVTGTVGDPDCTITVNGVQGTNDGYGNWTAGSVPLPPGGTVSLQATAQLSGGAALQTLLKQERDPVVFTQTYGYKLDYNELDWTSVETNGSGTVHIELQWARGTGGTHLVTSSSVDFYSGAVSSSRTVTVWPADNGYLPMLPGQQVISHYDDGELTSSYTNTVPAPTVEWMEKSASGGEWPEDFDAIWSESSGREVKLFTGGDACRQSQGLFDLTAPLTFESELDPNVPDWGFLYQGFSHFLWPAVPPVAVPSRQISLGSLGNLGADGHLPIVQLDGIEVGITPKAPESNTGPLPQAPKYKLLINWDNGPGNITDSNVTALVGQRITLSCSLVPETVPPLTNIQWTVPGTALSNFFVSPDSLQTNGYPVPLTDKTNATVRFCWVDRGAKFVTCKAKALDQDVAAKTTFSIKRPNATLTATIEAGVEVWHNQLRFQNSAFNGISFWKRDMDTAGDWQLIQLGHQLYRYQEGGTTNWSRGEGTGLDTVYPNPNEYDSPSTDLPEGGSAATADGSFTTYLAFRLTPTDVLVPIRQISWSWEGYAWTNGSGEWTGYGTANVDHADAPAPPTISWTNNIMSTLRHLVPEN